MDSFKIGNTEFGVGGVRLSMDNNRIDLEINGDENTFDQVTGEDTSEWSWALYPPKIYFKGIPYEGKRIVIDEACLNQYEIALYLMEHNDFTGTLEIKDKVIHVSGIVDMMGKVLPVSINVERSKE